MGEEEDLELGAAAAAAEVAEEDEAAGFDRASATSAEEFPVSEGEGAADLRYRFFGASSLSDISSLSGLDLSGSSSLSGLFYDCRVLADISPLSTWDVSGVRGLRGSFYGCRSLADISPLSGWDTSSVTGMGCLFEYCRSLVDASPLAGWDVSEVSDMLCLFAGCSSLEVLDLSAWDTRGARNMSNMFAGCSGLRRVTLGPDFSFKGDGSTSCRLPRPCHGVVPGRWQSDGGRIYEDPADVPDRTAASYTAVFELPEVDFEDLGQPGSWFYEAVHEMVERGYMWGRSEEKFGVNSRMKRADYVTTLWRIAEPEAFLRYHDDARNETRLSDVRPNSYYTQAVNWAVSRGIYSGRGNGKFGVGGALSFQDACLGIARLAEGGGAALKRVVDVDWATSLLADFADAQDVSAYAVQGVAWCVDKGIVGGDPEGMLHPRSPLTRERAAVILWRAISEKLI